MPIVYTELIRMLTLYNVRKGQIINQSRNKREAKNKADDARELRLLS